MIVRSTTGMAHLKGRSLIDYPVFFISSSTHRNSRLKKSNKMQQYSDIYLLLNYFTCFGRTPRPSSGAHKTAVAASGTDHTIWGSELLQNICILLHLVGFLQPKITTHGNTSIKFIDAKQAQVIFQFKNIKYKLYKTNAAIWYSITNTSLH